MQYASPVGVNLGGIDQAVMVAGSGRSAQVTGVDVSNGNILWEYRGWRSALPCPSVTPIGDGRIFVLADYGAGCAMFRVQASGGRFAVQELFRNRNAGSHVHNAILHDGYLYSNSSTDNKGLVCQALDGRTVWQTGRNPTFNLGGGLIIVNDLIYIINGGSGTLHMVEASPRAYSELGSAGLLAGDKIWAPLSFSDGRLIIRDQRQMKCVDVTAP
jgi:outer membrane protein assembly factor BamB